MFLNFQAIDVQMNPVYFMLPVCVSSSYSFMLPVATGPNALVYASGKVTMTDMVCDKLQNAINRYHGTQSYILYLYYHRALDSSFILIIYRGIHKNV